MEGEPWACERSRIAQRCKPLPSVQGCIHSVSWKAAPAPRAPRVIEQLHRDSANILRRREGRFPSGAGSACAEKPVPRVAEPGQDVTPLVQTIVDGSHEDFHFRVGHFHAPNAFRCGYQA